MRPSKLVLVLDVASVWGERTALLLALLDVLRTHKRTWNACKKIGRLVGHLGLDHAGPLRDARDEMQCAVVRRQTLLAPPVLQYVLFLIL